MDTVSLATTPEDAAAAEAVRAHHAEMAGTLSVRVERLLRAASAGDAGAAEDARLALARWCEGELVPHALAEEKAMYPAAHALAEGRLLVTGMLEEHAVITGLVEEVATAADPVSAAASAKALRVVFDSHLAKENDLVVPLLAADPDVSVAELLGGMHELLGEHAGSQLSEPAAGGCGAHACSCGESEQPGFPELDAREVPHAIRHATILGALEGVPPRGGMVLVAPHDPLPLLAQVEERFAGAFEVSYLERGPEAWKLVFLRRAGR
jgi:uncharacterized protein (DUF2249 family)